MDIKYLKLNIIKTVKLVGLMVGVPCHGAYNKSLKDCCRDVSKQSYCKWGVGLFSLLVFPFFAKVENLKFLLLTAKSGTY